MENSYEAVRMEVSLKEVIGQAAKTWKLFLAVGLIFAFIFGALKFIPTYKIYSDDEKSAAYKTKNDNKIAYLQTNIKDLEYEINKQELYFNESVYININPLYVQQGMLSYYISTPLTGEEYDYAEDILHAYENLFASGEIFDEIAKKLSYDIDTRYISEIVKIPSLEVDKTNKTKSTERLSDNYLDIKVIHSDPEKLKEIMTIIKEIIADRESAIKSQVGEYKISLVSENSSVVMDDDIKATRLELDSSLDKLESNLSSKKSELREIEKAYVLEESMIKNTVVYAALGFVLGVLSCFIFRIVVIIISGKIVSSNHLTKSKNINVLGEISEKKNLNFYEKFTSKLVGEDISTTEEEAIKVSAYNIYSFSNKKNIIILDLVDSDFSKKIINDIKKFDFVKDIKFLRVNNTLNSFETLEALNEDSGTVIIAEKLGTKLSRLEKERSIIDSHNGEFVGVILV